MRNVTKRIGRSIEKNRGGEVCTRIKVWRSAGASTLNGQIACSHEGPRNSDGGWLGGPRVKDESSSPQQQAEILTV